LRRYALIMEIFMEKLDTIPWYRQPFVWMIIAFPATSVVVGMTMLTLAIKTNDGLVVDDYYKKGLEINRTIARDKAAETRGLSGHLKFKSDSGRIHLEMRGSTDYSPPPYLELYLSHATRAGFDHFLSLERIGEGVYEAEFNHLEPGNWQLLLSADDWRLLGSVRAPFGVNQALLLQPAADMHYVGGV
jgi:uncharacterized protein